MRPERGRSQHVMLSVLYFNNDGESHAVENASTLRRLVSQQGDR